jgi:hypothetical protein
MTIETPAPRGRGALAAFGRSAADQVALEVGKPA